MADLSSNQKRDKIIASAHLSPAYGSGQRCDDFNKIKVKAMFVNSKIPNKHVRGSVYYGV